MPLPAAGPGSRARPREIRGRAARSGPLLSLVLALLAWSLAGGLAHAREPLADAHLHYTGSQAEVVAPEQALAILRDNDVALAVVTGIPPGRALALARVGGDWILPIFSPYLSELGRRTWYRDEAVVEAAREALDSGAYRGIGEVHLLAGLPPARSNRIFRALVRLAGEHGVPFLIHTDASDYRYFLPVCRRFPGTRFQWAHAGGILPADQVAALLRACPNVWIDLSARDPRRHVRSPITDEAGHLRPDWEALIREFPDRVLIGSDPVWPVQQKNPWDEPDTGWLRLGEFLDFHRRWADRLPEGLRRKVLFDNARRLYGR